MRERHKTSFRILDIPMRPKKSRPKVIVFERSRRPRISKESKSLLQSIERHLENRSPQACSADIVMVSKVEKEEALGVARGLEKLAGEFSLVGLAEENRKKKGAYFKTFVELYSAAMSLYDLLGNQNQARQMLRNIENLNLRFRPGL